MLQNRPLKMLFKEDLVLSHDYACLPAHVCLVPKDTEEDIGFPGSRVTDSCELPEWVLGTKPESCKSSKFS